MARTPAKRVITQRDNYVWLLMALLILFFLGSLAAQLDMEILGRVTAIALTAIILVAVWSVEQHRFPFSSKVWVTLIFVMVEGGETLFDYYHRQLIACQKLLNQASRARQ